MDLLNTVKLFMQRRILATILSLISGIVGVGAAAGDTTTQIITALVTFVPAILNLWSYLKKVDSLILDRTLAAALLPAIALALRQLGIFVPDEVLNNAYTATMALVSAVLSVWSRASTNPIQPTGRLATPNP